MMMDWIVIVLGKMLQLSEAPILAVPNTYILCPKSLIAVGYVAYLIFSNRRLASGKQIAGSFGTALSSLEISSQPLLIRSVITVDSRREDM
jgi:hypothetical protein